jgi:outer membrane protein assembly factor BamB
MYFRLIFLAILTLIHVVFANSEDATFKQGNINIVISKSWTLKKPVKSNAITLIHTSIPATINITQQRYLEPVTANAIYERRSTSIYDGWIKALSRPASSKELLQSNTSDSHLAVYIHQELNESLKLEEFFVAEYYFVDASHYYIVNLETSKQSWKRINSDWKYFLENFWLGEGKRPSFQPLDISLNDWIQPGNFNNTNFISADPVIRQELSKAWELSITSNIKNNDVPIITTQDHFFLISENHLMKIEASSGTIIWKFDIGNTFDKTYLSGINSLLFLKNSNQNQLSAISTDTGEVVFYISVNKILASPVFTQNAIYINDLGVVRKYALESGRLIWSHENYEFKNSNLFVSEYHLIGQIQSNEFVALDPEDGSLSWKTKPCKLQLPPTCTKDLLLVPVKEGKVNSKIIAFDLKDGSIKWGFNKAILNFSFTHEISATNDYSIVSFSILNDSKDKEFFLMRLNNETGEREWEVSTTAGFSRPILSNLLSFSYDSKTNEFLIIDTFTGNIIPNPELNSESFSQFFLFKDSIIPLISSKNSLKIQLYR